MIDSFTHTREGILDWHRNGERPFFLYLPFTAVNGPNQAPPEYLKKYAHLGGTGPQRAQLECMDIAIGQVLKAIQDKGLDSNTLVMFTNDNGGPERMATNGPYRGFKSAYHEGGIRVPAAMCWPKQVLPKANRWTAWTPGLTSRCNSITSARIATKSAISRASGSRSSPN